MPNSAGQIKEFFATPENPVSAAEFMEFWKSCSDEEKDYYKSADLG